MQKTIQTNELKVGMFVILQDAWYRHPFFTGRFRIESEKQIAKIRDYGIRTVTLDLEKSRFREERVEPAACGREIAGPARKQEDSSGPSAKQLEIHRSMEEVVRDRRMPSEEKARAVQKMSMLMMSDLLEKPTASNIRQAKKTISRVVDLIIHEDSTTKHLLQITSHDFQTYTHSVTVGLLGVSLSKVLFQGSDRHDLHELGAGFFLHDIGKVRVDAAIISKPGKLSGEEMGIIRRHPDYGFDVLQETNQLTEECRQIVLQHHERDDGNGYPLKLRSEEIHLYARICSIADVYEALTAERPYKRPMSPFDALRLMKEEMIQHFQKDLFDRFVLLFAGG
jgi:HD-GYP domain-containing protein (c-di-GMP phosphodiesterase class II)